MSRSSRYPSSPLSSSHNKWVGIIAQHWEETWRIVADRDDRVANHRKFCS